MSIPTRRDRFLPRPRTSGRTRTRTSRGVREQGRVWREPHHGVVMITGFDEAMAVYNDHATFSSCNTVAGPFAQWPVPLEGDDISEIIEQYRDGLPFSDQLPSFDPPRHTDAPGLADAADHAEAPQGERGVHVAARRSSDRRVHRSRRVRVRARLREPVHAARHRRPARRARSRTTKSFREELQGDERPTQQRGRDGAQAARSSSTNGSRRYIEDRRREPRDDVMTELATATFPDGTLPEVDDVMLIAANLFAAGGETTARLLATMLRFSGDRPGARSSSCATSATSSRTSSRRRCGSRRRCTRSSGWRASRRRSAASTSRPAPR